MDRADIDVLDWKHPLGHGSFGTVYRGLVRSLRTPARVCCFDPTNVPVAIKTINTATTLFDRRDFISEACHMKQFQTYHLVRLLGLVSRPALRRSPGDWRRRWIEFCEYFHLRIGTFGVRNPRSYSNQAQANRKLRLGGLKRDYSCLGLMDHVRGPANSATPPDQDQNKSRLAMNTVVFDVAPNSPLVIMELMSEGDLASYLRHLGDRGLGSVEPDQAYLWATQIADGMAYLTSKHYVHRDLAARNCLVSANLVVKIGDFGLCRQVYDRNYYQKLGHGRLPIRWMAPESLESAYFTSQSDVWSFGIVLWEIATMASLPYRGLSHDEVITYVLAGNTLLTGGTPTNCPELLEQLMVHCWAFHSHKRPTFFDLCILLAPRFGDAEFRAASFFYTNETVLESGRDDDAQVVLRNPLIAAIDSQTDDSYQSNQSVPETPHKQNNSRTASRIRIHRGTTSDEDQIADRHSDKNNVVRPESIQMRMSSSPSGASSMAYSTAFTANQDEPQPELI
ncbi:Tyrosine-protein kinase receptor [Fasciola hepatica]|uniref:Tyrosine-protein kinase receptor n=1 Tax=Fasciola hepatica TaxID=6192 RepID=A0A4E0RBQ7_FASHE|nr:Tyrosine-protein kinase receptor [Fasciola hepatica]